MTSGGQNRITDSPAGSRVSPLLNTSFNTRVRSSFAGSFVMRSLTCSAPIIRPITPYITNKIMPFMERKSRFPASYSPISVTGSPKLTFHHADIKKK